MVLQDPDNLFLLRNFYFSDSHEMAFLANNKKIWDNVRDFFPNPYKEQDAKEFIDICIKEHPQSKFAIEVDGKFAGVVGLVMQTDIYRKSAEIGYWLGEPYWNKGIMSKAVNLIIQYGFEELELVRIYTGVFQYNIASMKVLEKAGFNLECIFKKSVIKNNLLCDEHRYAILNPKYNT